MSKKKKELLTTLLMSVAIITVTGVILMLLTGLFSFILKDTFFYTTTKKYIVYYNYMYADNGNNIIVKNKDSNIIMVLNSDRYNFDPEFMYTHDCVPVKITTCYTSKILLDIVQSRVVCGDIYGVDKNTTNKELTKIMTAHDL
jgi:hypothetical protein